MITERLKHIYFIFYKINCLIDIIIDILYIDNDLISQKYIYIYSFGSFYNLLLNLLGVSAGDPHFSKRVRNRTLRSRGILPKQNSGRGMLRIKHKYLHF